MNHDEPRQHAGNLRLPLVGGDESPACRASPVVKKFAPRRRG